MEQIDSISRLFSAEVKKRLGPHLKSLILFGSRSRGDAVPGSDYDFLILVDKKTREITQQIRQTEVEFIDSYGSISGSLIYSEEEWEKRRNLPIGINVERAGIVL